MIHRKKKSHHQSPGLNDMRETFSSKFHKKSKNDEHQIS